MHSRLRSAWLVGALALGGGGPAREASAGSATKVADEPYPAEFRTRVRKSIELGLRHLRSGQMLDVDASPVMADIQFEEAAAVLWVLRRAGVPPDEPALVKASKRIRARAPKGIEEASLVLLGLCARPLAEANPFAVAATAGAKTAPVEMTPEDRALMTSTVAYLLQRQLTPGEGLGALGKEYDGGGGWGADTGREGRFEIAIVPSTYLALLGLEAAARSGAAVPATTWLSALSLLLGWQAPKGPKAALRMNEVRGTDRFEWTETAQARGFGWTGSMSDEPCGYETAAAALSLAMCQDALQKDKGFTKDLRRRTRLALRDAFAWIQARYDITANPVTGKGGGRDVAGPLYHHHWLQALARLELHARMRYVGVHDWYQEGAEELLKTQGPNGAWNAIWWSNCYALLFLMRASLPSIAPVVTVSEGG